MKKMLVLGVCALFIACNSSSEKSSDTDTVALVEVDSISMTSPTIDSANVVSAIPAAAIEVSETKISEVKVKETPVAKEVQPAEPVKPVVVAPALDTKKGESLISKSDCFACR